MWSIECTFVAHGLGEVNVKHRIMGMNKMHDKQTYFSITFLECDAHLPNYRTGMLPIQKFTLRSISRDSDFNIVRTTNLPNVCLHFLCLAETQQKINHFLYQD
jgi:hypothetical protein